MLQVNALPIIRNGDILRVKLMLLRSFRLGTLKSVEVLMPFLLLILLAIAAQLWGVDSRPSDLNRAIHWYPGAPRD